MIGVLDEIFAVEFGVICRTNSVASLPGLAELPPEKLFALLGTLPLSFAALGEASNLETTNGGTTEFYLFTFAAELLFTSGAKLGDILRTIGSVRPRLLWFRASTRRAKSRRWRP